MSNVKPAKNQAKNQTGSRTEKPVQQRERVNLGCGPLIIGIALLTLLAFVLPHGGKKPVKADRHSDDHTASTDSEMAGSRAIAPPIPKKTTPQKPAASGKNQEGAAPVHKTTGQRAKAESNTNPKPLPATGETPHHWFDRIKALLPWGSPAKSSSDVNSATGRSRQTPRKSGPENTLEPTAEKKPVAPKVLDKDRKPAQKPVDAKTPVKMPSSDQGASKKPEKQADQKSGSGQIPGYKKESPAPLSASSSANPPVAAGSKAGTKDHANAQDKLNLTNPGKTRANREEAPKPDNPDAHEKAISKDSDAANAFSTSGSEPLSLIRDLIAFNPGGKTPPHENATVAPKSSGNDNKAQTASASDQHEGQPAGRQNLPDTSAGRTRPPGHEHAKVMNGPWNNSVIQVEQYLKRNLFDADSFEALKWGMVTENSKGYQVDCTYRSKNLFGTLTTQTRTFYLNKKGDVYQVKETDKTK